MTHQFLAALTAVGLPPFVILAALLRYLTRPAIRIMAKSRAMSDSDGTHNRVYSFGISNSEAAPLQGPWRINVRSTSVGKRPVFLGTPRLLCGPRGDSVKLEFVTSPDDGQPYARERFTVTADAVPANSTWVVICKTSAVESDLVLEVAFEDYHLGPISGRRGGVASLGYGPSLFLPTSLVLGALSYIAAVVVFGRISPTVIDIVLPVMCVAVAVVAYQLVRLSRRPPVLGYVGWDTPAHREGS